MRTFCTLVIVGGAEHAQTFNFKTAADSDDDFELSFLPREKLIEYGENLHK